MSYSPRFHISARTADLLEEIGALNAQIRSAVIGVSWIPRLQRDSEARGAHGSTAIEGNPLTLPEVKLLAEGAELTNTPPRAVQEILNYFAVLRMISRKTLPQGIQEKDILHIHKLLGHKEALDRGPFGAYRDYQVVVGFHRPPPAPEVPHLMRELLVWLNTEGQKWPAVVSSAILHFQFENIHPFGDGNGRTGRALAMWELYRRKFDTHHVFAVDEILWEKRLAYYNALGFAQKDPDGDLTGWVQFIAGAVAESLRRAWGRIQRLPASSRGEEALRLTPKQEKLLTLLQEGPLGVQEMMKAFKVTKPGAHYLLKPLLKAKLIIRKGGYQSGKYFMALKFL